jgi:alkylresorcinol/alkylpyrone synthase
MGRIAGVATALPAHRYRQDAILRELERSWGTRIGNQAAVARLHARVGVDTRNLVMPLEAYRDLTTWGMANDAWIEHAQKLGERALNEALARAGLSAGDVDALFFTSITGICSPSIDALLMNRMSFRPNVKRVPIFGLGCVGGAACLARAADYVRAYPEEVVAVLAVEICSLTVQREDFSTANLISLGLFGDGAAAVIVAGAEVDTGGPAVLRTRSTFYPGSQDAMGWNISENGFKIVLSAHVPEIVRAHVRADVDAFLNDCALQRDQIEAWILHTGGPKVLEAMAESLDLTHDDVSASWECLREIGNLSSASVLAVLEKVVMNTPPREGTLGVLAAMGPGFCSELVLLQW